MRIVEIAPPVSFQDVVTPEYLKFLFDHGGTYIGEPHPEGYLEPGVQATDGMDRFVDDHWDEIEEIAPDLARDAVVLDDPRVQTFVKEWVEARFSYTIKSMQDQMRFRNGLLEIGRCITVTPKVVQEFTTGFRKRLGSYWSFYIEELYAPWSNGQGHMLEIIGFVRPADVDWVTTVQRNMDYLYGEYEYEVFLPQGTPVRVERMEYHVGDKPTVIKGHELPNGFTA